MTSPIPIPAGYTSAVSSRPPEAAAPAIAHSGDGSTSVCPTRTISAAGRTILFGMILRSRSVIETATSVAQKIDATTARPLAPNRRKQPEISSAVASSTAG